MQGLPFRSPLFGLLLQAAREAALNFEGRLVGAQELADQFGPITRMIAKDFARSFKTLVGVAQGEPSISRPQGPRVPRVDRPLT
jgi:hypothetical protein